MTKYTLALVLSVALAGSVSAKPADLNKGVAKSVVAARSEVVSISSTLQKRYNKLAVSVNKLAKRMNNLEPEERIAMEKEAPGLFRVLRTNQEVLVCACDQIRSAIVNLEQASVVMDASSGILGGKISTEEGRDVMEHYYSSLKNLDKNH